MTVRIPLATLVAMAIASTASAKVCVWTGAGTPSPGASYHLLWSDTDNWEDGNVPANGDTIVFVEKNTTTHRLNYSVEIENIYYTNTLGTTAAGVKGGLLKLTGTDSEIYSSGEAFNLNMRIELCEGAKLTLKNADSLSRKNPGCFFGSGEIEQVGAGDLNINYSSTDFNGTWRLRGGQTKIMDTLSAPFGSSNCVVHAYKTIACRYAATLGNKTYLHDSEILAYRSVTVDGDVTLVSETVDNKVFYIEGVMDATYYQPSSPPGFVFNGALRCDNSRFTCRPIFYAYSGNANYPCTNYFVKLNGPVDLGSRYIETMHKRDADRCAIYLNAPLASTSGNWATLSLGDKIYCGMPNVFSASHDVTFGLANKNTPSETTLDLCGHDQAVRRLIFTQSSGCTTGGSITSSAGPATLTTTKVYADQAGRTVVSLDGEVSLSLNKGDSSSGAASFTGGSTTGWIMTDLNYCDLTAAAFPNLGGISLKGAGVARVSATTALKSGVKLDFNSRSTGYLRLDSDVAITAAQVVDGGIDLAPGKYCRTGAGVENATEVDWLGGGEGYNGTVTVLEHTPSLIWTGAGDCTLSGAANWGANESPDLTDTTLTLDFRYATAENPILLSGTVAPACAMTSGDVSQGSPAFGGSGTLVLSGSAVKTNNFSFTGGASLTYSGTGTLVLRCSDSDTTGTLTVSSGKVVLDGSSWLGSVVVASGAELEVLSSCGSGVFSPAEGENRCGIVLNGKLTLGKGVSAMAGRIEVSGSPLRAKRTYGSSSSPASSVDDVHFGGEGVISVEYKPLGMVIICK